MQTEYLMLCLHLVDTTTVFVGNVRIIHILLFSCLANRLSANYKVIFDINLI